MRVAIQPDFVRQPNGDEQSFSARWAERAAAAGIAVETVDVFADDLMERVRGCDGFLWRFGYGPLDLALAKRLLPAIEHGLRIPVFPDWRTCWHFEDKLAQAYLLEAAGLPTPDTRVLWRREDALRFCRTARYPFVAKLASGIRSNNVRLIRNRAAGEALVDALFGAGVETLHPARVGWRRRVREQPLLRRLRGLPATARPRQGGYLYAQEFLPDNAFDTRVTVIGDRAFAFRRFNRPDDFRASGSGRISWEPQAIDLPTVHLAFRVADVLGTQSVAVDGMRRGEERVVGEVSYTYAAWAIRACPGHWRREPSGALTWIDGAMRAEDAIFDDWLASCTGARGRWAAGAA